MSNEDIIEAIRAGDNSRVSDLWENCQGIIKNVANRYRNYENVEDLTQDAFFQLCRCIDGYDPGTGATFGGYLAASLDGYYKRIIAKKSALSMPMYSLVTKYNQYTEQFEHDHGREPSAEESARDLGLSAADIAKIQAATMINTPASLDDEISDAEGLTLADMITDGTDPADTVINSAQTSELAAILWPMVDDLEDRERDVITRRYKGDERPADIARDTGLSSTQVHDLERRGLLKLREPKNRRKLSPFVEEYITSHLYRSAGQWTSQQERIAIWLDDRAPDVRASDL